MQTEKGVMKTETIFSDDRKHRYLLRKEGREVDEDDGGFVLVIESKEDLADFSAEYVDISTREYVELLPTAKEPYFNVFILYNEYEFGISLLIPHSIVPQKIQEEFMHETIKA